MARSDMRAVKRLDRPAAIAVMAVVLSAIYIAALCTAFNPIWETNDDVAMSMVAHGYGLAAYGSPTLIFSNVLWGMIVRSMPSIDGVLGYSVATLACLALAGAAIVYFLRRLGAPLLVAVLAMALVLLRPVLFPQFTMNSGLLAVAGILGVIAYARTASAPGLVIAVVLLVLGLLIRNFEAALVGLVALPLLPWRLFRDRKALVAGGAVLACAALAAFANDLAYQGPEWAYYFDLNLPRALFTDFGAGVRVLQHPDVMAKYGWSANDVALIRNYFFVDRKLADAVTMGKIISEVGFSPTQLFSHELGWVSLNTLTSYEVLPLALAGFGLLVVVARPPLLCAWVITLLVMYVMGGLGRIGVSRIYLPLLALLILAPLLDPRLHAGWRIWIATGIVAAAFVLNGLYLYDPAVASRAARPQFTSRQSTVIWGASLPFERMYPIFTRQTDIVDKRMFPLGVFTFAPFSVALADEALGKGMLDRLRSPEGVLIVATPNLLKLLATYCSERLQAPLTLEDRSTDPRWTTHVARCLKSP